MRLTLRGLLAYLDDRLAPESAAQVGDYIQDHDKIRQLTDRIKRVIRRRRLSTPDLADRNEMPPLHQDDPNEVAAFLDGMMTSEQEADFEEICVDTDVYLAEVAACHQIMTFGNDTLKVPPLAKQRMIGLVKGPEAQPMKIVPREARPSKPPLWEVSDSAPGHPDEENQALLEPIFHDLLASRWSRALLSVAAVLLVGFLGYIIWSMPWSKGTPNEAQLAINLEKANEVQPQPVGKAGEVAPPAAVAAVPVTRVQGVWPVAVVGQEGQPAWQAPVQTLTGLAGMLAARPSLPLNVLLGLGNETTPVERIAPNKPNESITPLPVVANNKARIPAPERTSRTTVATNGADTLGMFLQQNATGDFRIMKPQTPLITNEKLLALPGYTGHVSFPSGMRMILLGQFSPLLAANPYAEAMVELHPTEEADADITLLTGRLVLLGRPAQQGNVTVRLRYFGETWQITLPMGAELGVQARSMVSVGDGPWLLERHLELIGSKGQIEVKHDDQTATLLTRQRIQWNSKQGENAKLILNDVPEVPVWLAKYQTAPKEAVDSLVALRSRTHIKLEREANDLKWFALACEESLDSGKLIDRQAALLGLAVMNRMQPVVALQNDAGANGRRKYSHEVVRFWLNQDAGNALKLVEMLKEQGYTEADAKLLLALYRGVKQGDVGRLKSLLEYLAHDKVAIREQAWQLLTQLAPERPNIFDPAGALDQRTKAIGIITNKLNLKPAAAVAPPPK